MNKVLLVEDSAETQILVTRTLENQFDVTCASSIAEANSKLETSNFDLALIDVMLPDGDGFRLCAKLRSMDRTSELPIMFLTVKTNIADKITGFSLGADDYIVKPFEPLELRARVEAKLNRRKKKPQTTETIVKGDLQINLADQKAFLLLGPDSTDLSLTPIEFKLLYQFMTNEGKVLNRKQLMTSVWGKDINVEDRTIDRHISSLRKKLHKRSHYIESIYSMGYVFSLGHRTDKAGVSA